MVVGIVGEIKVIHMMNIAIMKKVFKIKYPSASIVMQCTREILSTKILAHICFERNKFRYKEMKNLLDKKENKTLIVLGSGKSVNEINLKTFQKFNSSLTIGVGRWIFHDFVPDVYYIETSADEKLFAWTVEFINILKTRVDDYSKVIIIFSANNSNVKKYIIDNVPRELKDNIRFSVAIKSISDKGFFYPFVELINKLNIPNLLNLLVHCRSSVAALVMLGYYINSKNCCLLGVDGYTGYFSNDPIFNKDYGGLDKNYNYQLHSTSNPMFGLPTLPDCIAVINSYYIKVFIITQNSVLYNVVEYKNINEIEC